MNSFSWDLNGNKEDSTTNLAKRILKEDETWVQAKRILKEDETWVYQHKYAI